MSKWKKVVSSVIDKKNTIEIKNYIHWRVKGNKITTEKILNGLTHLIKLKDKDYPIKRLDSFSIPDNIYVTVANSGLLVVYVYNSIPKRVFWDDILNDMKIFFNKRPMFRDMRLTEEGFLVSFLIKTREDVSIDDLYYIERSEYLDFLSSRKDKAGKPQPY